MLRGIRAEHTRCKQVGRAGHAFVVKKAGPANLVAGELACRVRKKLRGHLAEHAHFLVGTTKMRNFEFHHFILERRPPLAATSSGDLKSITVRMPSSASFATSFSFGWRSSPDR